MTNKQFILASCIAVLLSTSGCGAKKPKAHHQPIHLTSAVEHNALFAQAAGDRVFFAYDKSDLSAGALTTLAKQVEWLQAHPELRFTIEGHCDTNGTAEYNMALSERRANAVATYLISKGIDSSRFKIAPLGLSRPAVLGDTESAHAQNRRAVIILDN